MTAEQERALALARVRMRLKQSSAPVAEQPAPRTMSQEMEEQTSGDWVTGAQTGIANVGSRLARTLGTALLPESAEQWAEQKGYLPTEKDIELLKQGTAASTPAQIANIAGEVAATAAPTGALFKAVSALPRLGRLALPAASAASGGAGSAMLGEDVGEGAAIGGVLGPVMSIAGRAGSRLYGIGQDLTGGAEGRVVKDLRRTFGDRTDEVIDALRASRGFVPGEMPTAGRAASARFPELKTLEEAARNRPGAHRFLERDIVNEAAREAPLERMASYGRPEAAVQGGPIPLSPAESARRNVTRPMYAESATDMVPIDDRMGALLAGPEIQASLGRAERSVGQSIANTLAAGREPAALGTAGRVTRDPFVTDFGIPTAPQVTPPTLSVDALQRLKGQLDADITKTIDPLQKSQMETARSQLVSALRQASPRYGAAQDMFRRMSEPVNQAEVSQVLLNTLRNPAGQERAGAFLGAMRNAPATINRAGVPRFQSLEQIYSPTQMDDVSNVARSLQREAGYEGLPASRGILPEYLSPLETVEKMAPPLLSRTMTILRSGLKTVAGLSDDAAQQVVDTAMLDPNRLADLLGTLPPQQQGVVMNFLRQHLSDPATFGSMVGATTAVSQ